MGPQANRLYRTESIFSASAIAEYLLKQHAPIDELNGKVGISEPYPKST
jgi:hypothetical protein